MATTAKKSKAKAGLNTRRVKRAAYEEAVKTSKPGQGKRFAALEAAAEASGATNPGAVAAAIGRKKYGKEEFQEMATKGRKKAKKKG